MSIQEVTYSKTGAKLIWDTNSLEGAAKALEVINPGKGNVDYIQTMASSQIKDEPTWIGTGGWYVMAIAREWDEPGTMYCLVTLMPYSVNKYIEAQTAKTAK